MSEITNTTSINDLPTDPTNGGSNINLVVSESSSGSSVSVPSGPVSLDQTTISQIVSSLQQASLAGATSLPSRDISLNTEQLTNDVHIQPNYIPAPQSCDYIIENDDDINNYYKQERIENSLDSLYDEIQTPLLLGILYFIFQLPIMKKTIFKHASFMCNTDGNYNINGLIFTCISFGFIYYVLSKSLKHFSKF